MQPQQQQIREQQKQSWNTFSPGWKKWDDFNMKFLAPMGNAIINSLALQPGDNVLDIATGTGEPGLTIARITSKGKVTGTDIADAMLVIAREHAAAQGLSNYEAVMADVCELPFADNTFDAISCRMGFMFFPDMLLAAQEMYRVLKPGGRMATSVWSGPDKNTWVTTMMAGLQKHVEVPPPVPGAPGMFRCARPGMIAELLQQAGFTNTAEKEIAGKVDYEQFDKYWQIMMDLAAPVVAALSGKDDATKAAVRKDVAELFQGHNKKEEAVLDYAAIVISGTK